MLIKPHSNSKKTEVFQFNDTQSIFEESRVISGINDLKGDKDNRTFIIHTKPLEDSLKKKRCKIICSTILFTLHYLGVVQHLIFSF